MKKKKLLSPVWFLEDPLDQEQKEYILLGYLKSVSKDLNQENCYKILKEVSKIVKYLNTYKEEGKITGFLYNDLSKKDKDLVDKLEKTDTTQTVFEIIEKSLETLYEYSEICLEMLKEEESKIKIFKIQSRFESVQKNENFSSGILIIRNMITDKISNYFFKSRVKMKTKNGDKVIAMLKKIHLKNHFFSLSYEYIYHEILQEFDLKNEYFPSLYVIEIHQNFEEDSEIYKLSKERFIEIISDLSP